MPLPVELDPNSCAQTGPCEGDNGNTGGNSNPDTGQSQIVDLSQVVERSSLYNGQGVRYLDLNTCSPNLLSCINHLNTPLSTLVRYEFFFNDASPVIGQNPVFNTPRADEADTPFRQVIRVIVPDGYRPNTIRSSQDVAASQFRTEASNRVLNNPVVGNQQGSLPLIKGKAWLQNQEIAYLELGSVPYASARNQLGVGVVYFMRNQDKTDLPSKPVPIFDSVPGDLLYSPIRQVFRAVAENQVTRLADDPAPQIRSQDELLKAVNQGVFRLEDTGEFFNYPVYQQGLTSTGNTFSLSLSAARDFPPLPRNAHYALWVTNQLNQARLLLRFRGEGSTFQDLDGLQQIAVGPAVPAIFHFSQSELDTFRHFLVTIEEGDVVQPTGSTLLESQYESRAETELSVPFAPTYRALQMGYYMLAAPSASESNRNASGVWFVQRTDDQLSELPSNQDLEPGLLMALPPRGWVYNGWVLTDQRDPVWLQTGKFQAINQPDQQSRYLDNLRNAFTFPGEDFLKRAPNGLFFPIDLPSTGERELVVSLEPERLNLEQPYFRLFRTRILKGTQELRNQELPVNLFNYPILRLKLSKD